MAERKGSVMALNATNFREWSMAIRAIAEQSDCWDYVSPASVMVCPRKTMPPDVTDYSVQDPTPEGEQAPPPRPARHSGELTPEQNARLKEDTKRWQLRTQYYDGINAGIQTVHAAIMSSAERLIPITYKTRPVREILTFLGNQYQLTDHEIKQQIREKYKKLQAPPAKDQVFNWTAKWETLREEVRHAGIGQISEEDMVNEFQWQSLCRGSFPWIQAIGRKVRIFEQQPVVYANEIQLRQF